MENRTKKKMGRPRKYTPEEALKARDKRQNEYVKRAYKKVTFALKPELINKMDYVVKKRKLYSSARALVIDALEEKIKKILASEENPS